MIIAVQASVRNCLNCDDHGLLDTISYLEVVHFSSQLAQLQM